MKNKTDEILDKIWKEITGIKGEITGIKGEIGGIKGEIGGIKGEITSIKETMATKNQLSYFKNHFDDRIDEVEDKMATKDMFDRHMVLMDKSYNLSKNAEATCALHEGHVADTSDQVADHENRIRTLET